MDTFQFDTVMHTAITREVEAYEFYRDVANRVTDAEVKSIFSDLACDERKHQELLEKYKCDPTMILKIDAPDIDVKVAEATPLPRLTITMKPADAIALAMKKEQQAVETYRSLSKQSTDAQTKSIFENLANMELTHKSRLENLFVDIGYPESF
ncbi:MAG: ferritin family protein [Chitinivibrionales bacterium]|nr:ferritin family protein [Chitinivibrionales bacterium]